MSSPALVGVLRSTRVVEECPLEEAGFACPRIVALSLYVLPVHPFCVSSPAVVAGSPEEH